MRAHCLAGEESAEVLAKRPNLGDKELAKLVKDLELNPKQSPFSNKTDWTLRKVYEEDHTLAGRELPRLHQRLFQQR